jgi:peptidoglycan/LPS O-acetylase OafA/YrhL
LNFRWLSDFDGRRGNNLTVIRLLFAWSVLFGHSWHITGTAGSDPISKLFGGYVWIGEVAVNGFFAISGFLVAGSFIRHGLIGYSVARILRIWPGLIVCVLLSVFVLGWWETNLSTLDYFTHIDTKRYLSNMALWPRVWWYLPGVFKDHHNAAINGSLWTLAPETGCYAALAILGFFGVLDTRWRASVMMMTLLLVGYSSFSNVPFFGSHAAWARPMSYFVIGVLVWFNRQSLPLHPAMAGAATLIVIGIIASGIPKPAFYPIFAACLVYLVFFAAYGLPHVNADRFPGDISYGLYIYAWPSQQFVFWHGQSPWMNAALATLMAVILATASWYLIEKPALALKGRTVSLLSFKLRSSMKTAGPSLIGFPHTASHPMQRKS